MQFLHQQIEACAKMDSGTKLGRQTKWGADISVNLLRQAYDPILAEPIPAKLIKTASMLAEVVFTRLAAQVESPQGTD